MKRKVKKDAFRSDHSRVVDLVCQLCALKTDKKSKKVKFNQKRLNQPIFDQI